MSVRIFSGGDGLEPGSIEHHTYEIMMKSELRNGRGAYDMGNAGTAASGPSFGPFQYDIGANQDGRDLLESIATNAKDAEGQRIISDKELESIQNHLYKPFNTFSKTDRTVYAQLKPKLNAALRSDVGTQTIDADFVPGVQKKVAAMNAVVDGMITEPNKTLIQNSDVAKLILIDTKNQYSMAVNNGLKAFINLTHDDPPMSMPGRSTRTTIKVDGEFGLDDLIRYKLETQYGQDNRGAKDVLRRISHCIEAAGVENVKASLSEEDKTFLETGLENYLKNHGRDTTILDDPQLKALAKLSGRVQHPCNSHTHRTHPALKVGSEGSEVTALQLKLVELGFTNGHDHALRPDGAFGANTKAAVEKFQRAHHLTPDGIAGSKTLNALRDSVSSIQPNLSDIAHPGNGMYKQAQSAVYRLDAQYGRTPDQHSENFAAALAVAAHGNGMSQIDHVVLNDDASRAYIVQGDMNSSFKRYADVNVVQAVSTPVAQSSALWQHELQHHALLQTTPPMQQTPNSQMDQSVMQR